MNRRQHDLAGESPDHSAGMGMEQTMQQDTLPAADRREITPEQYNYATFPSDDDPELFAGFFEHLKPGERAPDPELLDLDSGEQIQLSDVTGGHTLTVIELGSFT